ncbi:trypsin-like serine peptidase [Kitasatospora cheerisanensis]|uniref:Putative peptidase n=1 Tax=Kitasatospora cheerisanensis KCTC 2395 TaxID=1348663 RepID=A0A066Z631_9ACTN|nr:trypsin-like peptidase domain-containing protein [Kitasatospora cheerisanensis]KDN85630.1 putative peptidase [Kitasatospora cheerisanensis KCTC 2395]
MLLLAATATGCDSAPKAEDSRPTARPAPADAAGNRIGALFVDGTDGMRACTAGVVHSRGRNLLITAAHCAAPRGTALDDLVFAPGYRDQRAPYGSWTVSEVLFDPRWGTDEDEGYDVAFLIVDPLNGRQIEDVVGADTVATGLGFGLNVTVTGYPNSSGSPITCQGRTTSRSSTQQRFDCAGFTDGTSGSPWVTDKGEVVGVIGGYQQGGISPEVSYSVAFGDRLAALYRQAGG